MRIYESVYLCHEDGYVYVCKCVYIICIVYLRLCICIYICAYIIVEKIKDIVSHLKFIVMIPSSITTITTTTTLAISCMWYKFVTTFLVNFAICIYNISLILLILILLLIQFVMQTRQLVLL